MGSILLGILLILLSVAMLARHALLWKQRRAEPSPDEVRAYHRRQFGRRMQASGWMLLLGVIVAAGELVADPYWRIGYWAFAGSIVCWLMVLAVADFSSTQAHFRRLSSEFAVGRAKLEEEIKRLREEGSNVNGRNGRDKPLGE